MRQTLFPHEVRFIRDLTTHRDAIALRNGTDELTYEELAERIACQRALLGTTRRLVMIEIESTFDSVVNYLAALDGGHAVLLASPHSSSAEVALSFDPDVWIGNGQFVPRRLGSRHELHPDLCLLLSTSGSSGSPKVVRLSKKAVSSNADAIVSALQITGSDRAITSLPLHYCYGLSVLHSHLAAGASVTLTNTSVVAPEFWMLAREHQVTSLATVPYSIDLMEQLGSPRSLLPSLRKLTCAGGKLDHLHVEQLAAHSAKQGWQFYVMYGQTEATARMAVLPPELARTHSTTVGQVIPGGEFTIVPQHVGEPVGELHYRGPNVMMGYAHKSEDLAHGYELESLATGDLARWCESGLIEIVGRRSRVAKVLGHRIDLDWCEQLLTEAGHPGYVVSATDEQNGLLVAVTADSARHPAQRLLAQRLRLPRRLVTTFTCLEVPRLPSGQEAATCL